MRKWWENWKIDDDKTTLCVQVKPFETKANVDAYLFDNAMHVPGALHFIEKNATVFSYGIQTNSTPLGKRGIYEDPTFKFQIPLQLAAEREIARSLLGGIRHTIPLLCVLCMSSLADICLCFLLGRFFLCHYLSNGSMFSSKL